LPRGQGCTDYWWKKVPDVIERGGTLIHRDRRKGKEYIREKRGEDLRGEAKPEYNENKKKMNILISGGIDGGGKKVAVICRGEIRSKRKTLRGRFGRSADRLRGGTDKGLGKRPLHLSKEGGFELGVEVGESLTSRGTFAGGGETTGRKWRGPKGREGKLAPRKCHEGKTTTHTGLKGESGRNGAQVGTTAGQDFFTKKRWSAPEKGKGSNSRGNNHILKGGDSRWKRKSSRKGGTPPPSRGRG